MLLGSLVDREGSSHRRRRRRIFGVRNHRMRPGPSGGKASTSMRTIAPFLNSSGCRTPARCAARAPISGSWPTSTMRLSRACFARSSKRDWWPAPGARDSIATIEGLGLNASATTSAVWRDRTEGTGQHDVERHAQPFECSRTLSQRSDALAGQRTFRVIGPRVSALLGEAVADQVQLMRLRHALQLARRAAAPLGREVLASSRSQSATTASRWRTYRACSGRQLASSAAMSVSNSPLVATSMGVCDPST